MNRWLVSLFLLAVTAPAAAVEDQYLATAEGLALVFTAEQLTGSADALEVLEGPSKGTLDVESGGLEFCYTPNAGFIGVDKFELGAAGAGKGKGFWVFVSVAPDRMPLAGDWNGDAVTETGRYDSDDQELYVYQANVAHPLWFGYRYPPAGPGWHAFAGDWDGDDSDEVGLYDPAAGVFHLLLLQASPYAPYTANELVLYTRVIIGPLGLGEIPVAGDWNGDGDDDLGLFVPGNPGVFQLWEGQQPRSNPTVFEFGGQGTYPVAGDWDSDSDETVGVYNPATGDFLLRNTNSSGPADEVRRVLGAAGEPWLPVAGDWAADLDPVSVGLFDPSVLGIALYPVGEVINAPIIVIVPNAPPCDPGGDITGC